MAENGNSDVSVAAPPVSIESGILPFSSDQQKALSLRQYSDKSHLRLKSAGILVLVYVVLVSLNFML